MSSRISWPPQDFKLPKQETREDVFAELLYEFVETGRGTKPRKYQLTIQWLQRYHEAND